MMYPFADYVDILGTQYKIELKTRDEDPGLRHGDMTHGYCSYAEKRIVINDRSKQSNFSEDEEYSYLRHAMKTLRHEIVHAFLAESGLAGNAKMCGSWATNEEMVDWIALQGPKITKAWLDAGALFSLDIYSERGNE